MMSKPIAGFIVNLLQDVNILRPLIYIAADNIGLRPIIFVTKSFLKRDKSKLWTRELKAISGHTNATIYFISSLVDVWQLLRSYSTGFIVSASESDLNAHRETHEIFRLTPSSISTVTLQHGFECVGFLMNRTHQKQHGNSVGFASDYICGWTPRSLQRNLRPLQHSRYLNLGPTAWLKRTDKRRLDSIINPNPSIEMGIVCENLHSVRFGRSANVNSFMQQFLELAEYLQAKGKKIALRPHPGGQYSIKNNLSLPKNVVLVNQPSYKVNWKTFSFGISAPSSVLFDLMVNEVPALVWQDQDELIDINQLSFLPIARNTNDMILFANHPLKVASSSTNQQLSAIFRDDNLIAENYTDFLRSLCGLNIPSKLIPTKSSRLCETKKIRILVMAPSVTPSLTISFIKPFSLIPHLVDYKLIHETGDDVLGRDPGKEANARRCKQILDTFQPDVLILCRYANKDAIQLSAMCNASNVKVIYYTDDMLFKPSTDVLDAKKYANYKKRAPVILDLIKKSDLLYCSTPALKKELAITTNHPNIHVGKICLSVNPGSMTLDKNKKKVIGYTGFGHTQDLESIEDILLEVLSDYPDWRLELIGTMIPSPKLLSLGDRITLLPPEKDYDKFLDLLRSRNWSIGICPLLDNPFNTLKANNKWIEYSCCNIATIASDLEPYKYATADNCLFLCGSPQAWKESFDQLINSPDVAYRMTSNSQEFIRQNFSETALSLQVFDLIKGLVEET